jgi:hypothetical protein
MYKLQIMLYSYGFQIFSPDIKLNFNFNFNFNFKNRYSSGQSKRRHLSWNHRAQLTVLWAHWMILSSQVNTLPKAKSKTRSKQNKDMQKCSSVYSERGVPLPVLTSGGEWVGVRACKNATRVPPSLCDVTQTSDPAIHPHVRVDDTDVFIRSKRPPNHPIGTVIWPQMIVLAWICSSELNIYDMIWRKKLSFQLGS